MEIINPNKFVSGVNKLPRQTFVISEKLPLPNTYFLSLHRNEFNTFVEKLNYHLIHSGIFPRILVLWSMQNVCCGKIKPFSLG